VGRLFPKRSTHLNQTATVLPGETMAMLRKNRVYASTTACLLAVALCAASSLSSAKEAHAAVAILLEQPYGKLNIFEPAGHSAIYLDHVCAETPLKLRPCRAGEMGVVLSRYDGIGNHDWVAMPLVPYLYGVASAEEIPDAVDKASEFELRDAYRRRYLESLSQDLPNGDAPHDNWYELVGSAFDRTIYGFQVSTTPQQDAKLIAEFNDEKNTEKYNGMFRNCADFVRVTINRYYPHAIRRNYIADLGLTSPKSVARGLSHYAHKHPDVGFEVFVIPQVMGSLPRSHNNMDLMECALKRFGALGVLFPPAAGVVAVAYVGHGRFSMPKDAPLLAVNDIPVNFKISRPFPVQLPLLPQPVARKVSLSPTTTLAALPRAAAVPGLVPVQLNR
jgi:hypothetical protein